MDNSPPGAATCSLRLEFGILPPQPPLCLIGMARALLRGIPPLASAEAHASTALAFVAAQVTECALKAFLWRKSDEERLRRKPLRHNLLALWQLAEAEGLPLAKQPPGWLSVLSELHDDPYCIRYATNVHGMMTPASEPMATDLAALVDLVGRELGKQRWLRP